MKRTTDIETLFRALGDRTRLRLLNLMRDGELCVCVHVEILRTTQPTVSRHLAYLRRAGVVEARRDGKWMHYRITEPDDAHRRAILRETLAWLREDPEMKRDHERLRNVCCSAKLPASLVGVPLPIVNITLPA